jgi:hypothetical protein
VIAALAVALLLAAAPSDPAPPPLDLPAGVRPLRAELELTVDPAAERFTGRVRYALRLERPAEVIWLHAEGLEVGRAVAGGLAARVVSAPGGFLGLVPGSALPAGPAELELEFAGAVDRQRSRGLYAVPEGEAWYAYTFFEPVDARRAFPCFDEPWAKIPWRLSLRVPEGDVALANAPVSAERADGPGWRRVDFAESLPLPSYLVAFVVGPFDLVDGGGAGGGRVPIRFVVPRGRGAETGYAREVTGRLVDLLEAATGVPYPFEKCDVAVVPRFWGTMEHPGLVALGQPLTLMAPGADTRARRERYATIAAHELAHHWYGDLVTPASWEDTWLNESFASWLDAPVVEALEPAWRALATSRWRRRAAALAADVLPSVRRLRQPVTSRHDVEAAFDDAITYDKGATLLSAFEALVGPDRWRQALRDHLLARSHAVATGDDLLAALSARAGPATAAALRGFLDQPGVPLLRSRVRCDGHRPRLVVRQERLLLDPHRAAPGRWAVPVCAAFGAGGRRGRACALLSGPVAELTLPFCPEWAWPNAGGTGYHVSALAAADLPVLAAVLDLPERLALATDAALLARRGDLPVEAALALAARLAAQPDRLLVEASLELHGLRKAGWLEGAELARWRALLRRTYGPRARALGWLPRPDDDEEARALRRLLVPLVAGEGAEAVLLGEALALSRRWLADRRQVPEEVAWPALAAAVRHGDAALFEQVRAAAGRASDRTEAGRLTALLGRFEDPDLARQALAGVLADGADLRDTLPVVTGLLAGRATRSPALSFVRQRWDELAPRLRSDEGLGLIEAVAATACDLPARRRVADFLAPRAARFDGGPEVLARALDAAGACAAERARLPGRR